MKLFIFFIGLLFIKLIAVAQTGQYLPGGLILNKHTIPITGNWKLVWADEFNGSSIDQTKWVTHNQNCPDLTSDQCSQSREFNLPDGTHQNFMWKDENVIVNGGVCTLRLKRENCSWYDRNFEYSSGMIASRINPVGYSNIFERGMFEASIKFASAHWSHQTFWIWNDEGSEIDICEYLARNKKTIPSHLHRHNLDCDYDKKAKYALYDDFHTYTAIWDKYFIYIFFDHNLIATESKLKYFPINDDNYKNTISTSQVTLPGYYWNTDCFFSMNYEGKIIFSLELATKDHWWQKQFKGDYSDMQIEWVRVYQRDECDEDEVITNPVLFPYQVLPTPYHGLENNDWTSEHSITLGTQDNSTWTNISGRWGGHYRAQTIEMLPNFQSYPEYFTPSGKYASFLYEAKECMGSHGILPLNEYIDPEIDSNSTISDDDSLDIEYCEFDTVLVDSALVSGDSGIIEDILASGDSSLIDYMHDFLNHHSGDRKINPLNTAAINATNKSINIYPNPNKGSFYIETPRGNYDIQIVNLLGVVVQHETIENDTKKNIVLKQELAAGNYMVNIKGNGYTEVKRITLIK